VCLDRTDDPLILASMLGLEADDCSNDEGDRVRVQPGSRGETAR
jgi:hypothetical protein